MKRKFALRLLIGLLAASPAIVLASGYQPSDMSSAHGVQGTERLPLDGARPAENTTTVPSHIVVSKAPYNLGESLFTGKYKPGHPKLSESNVAEKKLRLASLQHIMPSAEARKIDPEMGARLTNQEMNAYEYFLTVRYRKLLNKPPSWAKQDPPVKVTFSN